MARYQQVCLDTHATREVVDCKDLGGENCRMTVWIKMEKPELIAQLGAREFAMVYRDFEKQVIQATRKLGLKVIT